MNALLELPLVDARAAPAAATAWRFVPPIASRWPARGRGCRGRSIAYRVRRANWSAPAPSDFMPLSIARRLSTVETRGRLAAREARQAFRDAEWAERFDQAELGRQRRESPRYLPGGTERGRPGENDSLALDSRHRRTVASSARANDSQPPIPDRK